MKFFAVSFILVQAWMVQAAVFQMDPSHSQVGFGVKHLMVSNVKGHFKKFSGSFDYDSAKKTLSDLSVTVDTASVDTNDAKRDDHLRADDFFAVKKFPVMTFKGQKAEFSADGKTAKVTGALTIRNKTKDVTFEVSDIGEVDFMGTKKMGFVATTTINRKDFDVSWNKPMDKGGLVVGDDVTIRIEGEANLADAKKPVKK